MTDTTLDTRRISDGTRLQIRYLLMRGETRGDIANALSLTLEQVKHQIRAYDLKSPETGPDSWQLTLEYNLAVITDLMDSVPVCGPQWLQLETRQRAILRELRLQRSHAGRERRADAAAETAKATAKADAGGMTYLDDVDEETMRADIAKLADTLRAKDPACRAHDAERDRREGLSEAERADLPPLRTPYAIGCPIRYGDGPRYAEEDPDHELFVPPEEERIWWEWEDG